MPDQILVLVAEDEALVRFVIVDALEDAGFDVIEAEHAEAALGVLQIHAARIHVLFTDIHMPGAMDGLALAHHAATRWPKIALLLTSGRLRPISRTSPRKAGFWQNPIGTTSSFVIFASLPPRRKPEQMTQRHRRGRASRVFPRITPQPSCQGRRLFATSGPHCNEKAVCDR
jgi:CheY-like chemotaxis protein